MSDLHDRIARALGWSAADVRATSMQSLRDLVRPVNSDLAQEIGYAIQSGAYAVQPARSATKVPTFKISTVDPKTMTASQINKELDRLDEQDSKLGELMIASGRGHERPSEYLKLADPLSTELRKNADRRQDLRIEKDMRYGGHAPARLPTGRGYGPRVAKTPTRGGIGFGKRLGGD